MVTLDLREARNAPLGEAITSVLFLIDLVGQIIRSFTVCRSGVAGPSVMRGAARRVRLAWCRNRSKDAQVA